MRGGGAVRRPAGPGCVGMALCAVAAAAALVPGRALALQVGGSLGWNLARTESHTQSSNPVQESFGQSYRINLGGAVLNRRIAGWSGGLGWRDDLTSFSGVGGQPNREVTLTNLDFGLLALPTIAPTSLNVRRAIHNSDGGASSTNDTVTTTVSLSSRVPMYDGNPLGLSAYQITQDPGTGSTTSRLVSLDKKFDLSARTDLSSAYQFSDFDAPSGGSTGHALSLSSNTEWSDRVASKVYGNVSTRSSTTTRSAGGRSLFLNNSAGGNVNYRRGREAFGTLAYSYSESPQDQGDDIQSHLLSGRGDLRVDKKTDVAGRFTARRLDLPTVTLDTATANVSLTRRPRLGWSTGGSLGLAANRTDGPTSSDRNTVSASTFFNARSDFVPAQVNWGGNVSYSTSKGDFAQDRLQTTAHLGADERRLKTVRIGGSYRFTDIQEDKGHGLDPVTQDHGLTASAHVTPLRGLVLASDVLTAELNGSQHWSRQYRPDRKVRTTSVGADAKYIPRSGLVTTLAFDYRDNSSDIGGAHETLLTSVSWTHRAFQRGSLRLSGDLRRNWEGNDFESQEAHGALYYDYSVGLLRISFSADGTLVDLGRAGTGTDTTHVRLDIVRTF